MGGGSLIESLQFFIILNLHARYIKGQWENSKTYNFYNFYFMFKSTKSHILFYLLQEKTITTTFL